MVKTQIRARSDRTTRIGSWPNSPGGILTRFARHWPRLSPRHPQKHRRFRASPRPRASAWSPRRSPRFLQRRLRFPRRSLQFPRRGPWSPKRSLLLPQRSLQFRASPQPRASPSRLLGRAPLRPRASLRAQSHRPPRLGLCAHRRRPLLSRVRLRLPIARETSFRLWRPRFRPQRRR
jgi:hypothetical protein